MNHTTKIIIGAVVLAVLAFWAGTAYANHKKAGTAAMMVQNGQFAGRGSFGGGMTGGIMRGGNNGRIVTGTVLSKTDMSVTVETQVEDRRFSLSVQAPLSQSQRREAWPTSRSAPPYW
jgi:hypothetical protein